MARVLLSVWLGCNALAWLPLLARFRRSWQQRENPVSLAICASLLLNVYCIIMGLLLLWHQTSAPIGIYAVSSFTTLVLINFYAAFHWSSRKFKDQRKPHTIPPTNAPST